MSAPTREPQARDYGSGPRLLVSVVISCFNYERFVGEAIRSALEQDSSDTEVIVVDDGSEDRSREVIAAYRERVTVISKENGGQASALNIGFRSCRGDVVIFLDADDLLLPGAALAVTRAMSDPAVAKAHWSLPIVDAQGRRTGVVQDPELAEGDLRPHVLREGPLSDETMPNPPMSGNAFSRWFLERVMPIPEAPYRTGADEYLFGLAPAFGRIVRLAPQSLYRVHGDNDHIGWRFERMLAFQEAHHAIVSSGVAEAYSREELDFDEEAWSRSAWWVRAGRVVSTIEATIPAGEQFALIDGGALGVEHELRGRTAIPFPAADGEFAGCPESDEAALAELARLRADGVRYFVTAWPAFWWLQEYVGLAAALRVEQRSLIENVDVVIFGPGSA